MTWMLRGTLLVSLLGAALAWWACWFEPRRLVIRHERLDLDGLEGEVRLLVVGDLQPAGPHETPARLAVIVDRLAQEEVDLVVWVGDFVSERRTSTSFTPPQATVAAMGRLRGPQLAVLGNHDWWWDGPRMEQLLEGAGIEVLRDEHRVITVRGQRLVVAGVEDPVTRRPDLAKALAGVEAGAATVLLTHTPDLFPEVPQHVDLTLAGHTHCGQVTIPGWGRPVVPSAFGERFASGLHGSAGHWLRVTCGIGTAILPVRFGNPPEALVLTLH